MVHLQVGEDKPGRKEEEQRSKDMVLGHKHVLQDGIAKLDGVLSQSELREHYKDVYRSLRLKDGGV